MELDEMPERFRAKVRVDDGGCWLWLGALNRNGYAVYREGTMRVAHRVAYEMAVGDIPEEHDLHHYMCPHRHCVNPAHVVPVDRLEHRSHHNRTRWQSTCPNGHEYEADSPSGGRWRCRICRRESKRRYRQRRAGK